MARTAETWLLDNYLDAYGLRLAWQQQLDTGRIPFSDAQRVAIKAAIGHMAAAAQALHVQCPSLAPIKPPR